MYCRLVLKFPFKNTEFTGVRGVTGATLGGVTGVTGVTLGGVTGVTGVTGLTTITGATYGLSIIDVLFDASLKTIWLPFLE